MKKKLNHYLKAKKVLKILKAKPRRAHCVRCKDPGINDDDHETYYCVRCEYCFPYHLSMEALSPLLKR